MKKSLLALLFTLLGAGLAHANPLLSPTDEPPAPEQVFKVTTRAVDANTLELKFTIDGCCYLYRDKFKFESLDPAITLKPAQLPAGKIKDDPGFGKVEVYTKSVTVRVPIERRGNVASAKLKLQYQGCNEKVGICYPPQTGTFTFALPAAKAAAGSLADLAKTLSPGNNSEPLPVDQAFLVAVDVVAPDKLRARFAVTPGHYLYRDKIAFTPATGSAFRLGDVKLPKGEVKIDPYVGRTETLRGEFSVDLPVIADKPLAQIALDATWQGCADRGICYAPVTRRFTLDLAAPGAAATPAAAPPAPAGDGQAMKFLLAMATAFGVGLLLTFTPCVLPMIPILASVLVGSADRRVTKLEGAMLASAYVLGTAVTYTAAGVLAGATGGQLQAYFQNPWAIGAFSALFGFLALSMFGLYELQMPSSIQSMLHKHSADIHLKTKHTKVGALFGVFGMGLLSSLVVGACVSPLLISALTVAIAERDPVLGGAIMFSMALGMGVILIAIGIGAGFLIPKAGPWMEKVKHVFGVLILAVAIYILGALPEVPVLLLWAALFIITGVYLGATQTLPGTASGWDTLWKGLGTLLIIWGIFALVGGFYGERDVMKPLPRFATAAVAGATAPAEGPRFRRLTTVAELDQALNEARAQGKPVLLDFYATWCTDCVRMEKTTFSDARVQQAMSRFVLLKADITELNDETNALKKKHAVLGPPALLFFDKAGAEKRELRVYGFRGVDEFLTLLDKVR